MAKINCEPGELVKELKGFFRNYPESDHPEFLAEVLKKCGSGKKGEKKTRTQSPIQKARSNYVFKVCIPKEREAHPGLSQTQAMSDCSKMFKEMSDSEKLKYAED